MCSELVERKRNEGKVSEREILWQVGNFSLFSLCKGNESEKENNFMLFSFKESGKKIINYFN